MRTTTAMVQWTTNDYNDSDVNGDGAMDDNNDDNDGDDCDERQR